jgi:hypothetical protein
MQVWRPITSLEKKIQKGNSEHIGERNKKNYQNGKAPRVLCNKYVYKTIR